MGVDMQMDMSQLGILNLKPFSAVIVRRFGRRPLNGDINVVDPGARCPSFVWCRDRTDLEGT